MEVKAEEKIEEQAEVKAEEKIEEQAEEQKQKSEREIYLEEKYKYRKTVEQAREEFNKCLLDDAEKLIDDMLKNIDYAIGKRWKIIRSYFSDDIQLNQIKFASVKERVEEEFKRLGYKLVWMTREENEAISDREFSDNVKPTDIVRYKLFIFD